MWCTVWRQIKNQKTRTWSNLNSEHDKDLNGPLPDAWVGIFEHRFKEPNEVAGLDRSNSEIGDGGFHPLQDLGQYLGVLLLQQNWAHCSQEKKHK